ncbi:MAG: hypothetical protein ACFB8W_06905 [Elainellaceae cyanobacterium]
MLYQERLKTWAIIRSLPDRKIVVDRFRTLSDAEGHLKLLRRRMPDDKLVIIFERPPEE